METLVCCKKECKTGTRTSLHLLYKNGNPSLKQHIRLTQSSSLSLSVSLYANPTVSPSIYHNPLIKPDYNKDSQAKDQCPWCDPKIRLGKSIKYVCATNPNTLLVIDQIYH